VIFALDWLDQRLVPARAPLPGARLPVLKIMTRPTCPGLLALAAAIVCLSIASMAPLAAQGTPFTQAESDSFARKILTIERLGATGAGVAATARTRPNPSLRLTPITERELNAYFRYDMRDSFPAGVTEPTISILGDGRVSATAVVDLDEVRSSQDVGLLNPMRYMSGRLPVTASGVIQSQHGTIRFLLDSADVSGVPIPKGLLQQVVSYYSRTAERPQGVNLDDALDLPAGIQEIRVQPGQAIVVQ
jgi:hypothetical protein